MGAFSEEDERRLAVGVMGCLGLASAALIAVGAGLYWLAQWVFR